MTLKECVDKVLAKKNLVTPDKRPLYLYETDKSEYEHLNNAVLRRWNIYTRHGLDAISDDNVFCKAFILYAVETIRRNGIGCSWRKFEKIMDFHFDENLIHQIIQNGLIYWGRPVIENIQSL